MLIVSRGQQRDSGIHSHVSLLSQTPLPSRLPHDMEQSSLCCPAGPCWFSMLSHPYYPWFFHSSPPATIRKHNPLRTKLHCVAASLATCLQRGGSSRLTHSSPANFPQREVCRLHALPTAPKTVSMATLPKGI